MKNIFYLPSFSYFKHILKTNELKILYNLLQKQSKITVIFYNKNIVKKSIV